MPLKINGSTSGSVTLAAPATGSDVTLTLPTLGFGKVLQVVAATTTTRADITGSTYTDTNLSATITPAATTSKILVFTSQAILINRAANTALGRMQILRGSTVIQAGGQEQFGIYLDANTAAKGWRGTVTMMVFDSPNTTSATTYKTQVRNEVSGDLLVQYDGSPSTIVLVEVAA